MVEIQELLDGRVDGGEIKFIYDTNSGAMWKDIESKEEVQTIIEEFVKKIIEKNQKKLLIDDEHFPIKEMELCMRMNYFLSREEEREFIKNQQNEKTEGK